jgi:H/ACA ribonucleoprotein complex non-core subunit NAF1
MPPFSAVQPHINPRFANAFGLAMYPNARAQEHGYVNPASNFNPFGQAPQPSSDQSGWTNAWSGSSQQGYGSGRPGEGANNT